MNRFALKTLNNNIADLGVELVRGRDYFYLVEIQPGILTGVRETGFYFGPNLCTLSIDEWTKVIKDRISTADRTENISTNFLKIVR